MTVTLAVMLCGCVSFREAKRAAIQEPGFDQSLLESEVEAIKVAVFDCLVRKELSRATNAVFFVALREGDMSTLRSKLPAYRFKPEKEAERIRDLGVRDKTTKETGVILRCGKVRRRGDSARLLAGYRSSTLVIHEFVLRWDTEWRVIDVGGPGIFDLR